MGPCGAHGGLDWPRGATVLVLRRASSRSGTSGDGCSHGSLLCREDGLLGGSARHVPFRDAFKVPLATPQVLPVEVDGQEPGRVGQSHDDDRFGVRGPGDYLSEAIRTELEATEIEVAVDSFSADIIAKDVGADDRVLIENQLERVRPPPSRTDPYVLGRSGREVRGLDRPALPGSTPLRDQLAQREYQRRIRLLRRPRALVRIGDSPFAPVFEVVEKPNAWERALGGCVRTTGWEAQAVELLLLAATGFAVLLVGRRPACGNGLDEPPHCQRLGLGQIPFGPTLANDVLNQQVRVIKAAQSELSCGRTVLDHDMVRPPAGVQHGRGSDGDRNLRYSDEEYSARRQD